MKGAFRRLISTPFVREATILQSSMWVTTVLQAVVGIAVARILGAEQLGQFALVTTVVATVSAVTNIGQNFSALTLLSEASTRQSKTDADAALAHFAHCSGYWSVPLTLAAMALVWLCPLTPNAKLWITLSLLALLPSIITDIVSIALQGTRRIKQLAGMETTFAVTDFGLLLAGIIIWPTVTGLLVSRLIASGIRMAISFGAWKWYLEEDPALPGLALRRWLVQTPIQRQAFALSGWIAADVQVDRIFRQVPYYLLGLVAPLAMIGQYRALMSYIDLSNSLSGAVGRLLGSVLPRLHVKDKDAFERSFWKANISNFLISSTVLFILLASGNAGLTLFFGPEYAVPTIVYWLLIPLALNGLTVGFGTYYRVHRALYLVLWGQVVSAAAGIATWILFHDSLSPLVNTVAAVVVINIVSKLCHAVNFAILRRRQRQKPITS